MTFSLEFDSMPDPLVRGNARFGHWAKPHRATRELRDTTYAKMLMRKPWPRFERVIVTYHAYWCGKPLDPDNLIKGCKPILDEFSDKSFGEKRLIRDDGPDYVEIRTEYTRVPHRRDVKLVVTVRPSDMDEIERILRPEV
jgi:hypothetical protein